MSSPKYNSETPRETQKSARHKAKKQSSQRPTWWTGAIEQHHLKIIPPPVGVPTKKKSKTLSSSKEKHNQMGVSTKDTKNHIKQ